MIRSKRNQGGEVEPGTLTIHEAGDADAEAIRWLAERDSAPVPRGRLLLAEQDGVAAAAVASDGTVIADPFRPTAGIVAVLELRARQRDTGSARRPREARRRRLGVARRGRSRLRGAPGSSGVELAASGAIRR